MKRPLRIVLALLIFAGVLFCAFWGFIFWASGRDLSDREYDLGELAVNDAFSVGQVDGEYTIVTYNIGYASGMTNNSKNNASEEEYEKNLETIIDAIVSTEADFVCLQEVDFACARSYDVDQLAVIRDELEFPYLGRSYVWDRRYLPWPKWPPWVHYGRIRAGHGILSKIPIEKHYKETMIKLINADYLWNLFYCDHVIQVGEVNVGDETLIIINTHLEAFDTETRERHAARVAEQVTEYGDQPIIVVGDFNAIPSWTKDHTEKDGQNLLEDKTIPTLLADAGLKTAITREQSEGENEKKFYTFRDHDSRELERQVDYILYNEWVEPVEARVLQDAGTGSDHLPVVMKFKIKTNV